MNNFDELKMVYVMLQEVTKYFLDHDAMSHDKWCDFMETHMKKVRGEEERAA